MKKIYGLMVLAAIFAYTPLAGQIITDRPDFADATTPVPVGTLQLESGYMFGKTPGASQHTVGQLLVKTGLTESMELRLGVNSYQKIDANDGDLSGFGDGSLGIKFRLLEGGQETGPGSFNLSTILFSGIPSGQQEFRATHLSPGAMLTADMTLSPSWTWAPFVQYDYTEDELGQYNQFSADFRSSGRWEKPPAGILSTTTPWQRTVFARTRISLPAGLRTSYPMIFSWTSMAEQRSTVIRLIILSAGDSH